MVKQTVKNMKYIVNVSKRNPVIQELTDFLVMHCYVAFSEKTIIDLITQELSKDEPGPRISMKFAPIGFQKKNKVRLEDGYLPESITPQVIELIKKSMTIKMEPLNFSEKDIELWVNGKAGRLATSIPREYWLPFINGCFMAGIQPDEKVKNLIFECNQKKDYEIRAERRELHFDSKN